MDTSKKKKVLISAIIIFLIIVVASVFLFKWYDIEPKIRLSFQHQENDKVEKADFLYDEYSSYIDFKAEKIKVQYVIEIESGSVNFKLMNKDTNEVLYESEFSGEGNHTGFVDIQGDENLSFVYEMVGEELRYIRWWKSFY